jgi:CDP-glycerol glycerophosphotransferase
MSSDFEKIAKTEAKRAVLSHETEQTLRLLSAKKRKSPSILLLGRDGFSDNSKYLYLALTARALGFPVFWGTFNPALHAELNQRNLPVIDLSGDSAKVMSVLFEISCVVYCTNPAEATRNPFYRAALAGAHKLQLWHGIGLKTLDLQNTATSNLLHFPLLTQLAGSVDIDEVLSPSSLYDDQWREAFGVDRILRAGFPRNEVLVRPATEHELIDASTVPPGMLDRGFVLYAPTFTMRGAVPAWLNPRLIVVLEGFAQRLGVPLAIKPHPFDREPTPAEAARMSPATLLLGAKTDAYPVLQHAKVMVTDVSSMASDFLLCDKPVLFFHSHTLESGDYPARCLPELPGRHVREETVEAFMAAWESIEETAAARRRLRQLYFETDPLQACDTIIRRLTDVVQMKSDRKVNP